MKWSNSWIPWAANFLLLSACSTTHFTTPICGPKSFDQRPSSPLPDSAMGCYRVTSANYFYSSSNNVFSSRDAEPGYIWIAKDGAEIPKALVTSNVLGSAKSLINDEKDIPICDVPIKGANPNSRVVMNLEHGWGSFLEYTFDLERKVLVIGSYETSADQIKQSGLNYVAFPSWSGKDTERAMKYPASEILSGSVDFVLIDNSKVTPEALFEQLRLKRSNAVIEFPKVDMRFCQAHPMQRIL